MSRKPRTEAERVKAAYDKALTSRPAPIDEREKDIIEKYYAFNGHSRHTLEEIAKDYQVTRERIRQIKHYALRKIGATDS